MRLTKLAVILVLVFGAVGTSGAQTIAPGAPWAYIIVRASLTATVSKDGVEMAKMTFPAGTHVGVTDGTEKTGTRRDFKGSIELRVVSKADVKGGAAHVEMSRAPVVLKADGIEIHLEGN